MLTKSQVVDATPEEAKWEEPASPEEIADQVHAVVKAIERPGSPEEAGIDHFGLHMTIGTEEIGISDRGSLLLVTIYRITGAGLIGGEQKPATCPTCGHTKHPPHHIHPGYSKGVHDKRMRVLAQKLGAKVREHWNGSDNHSGVSVVFDYPCPSSLLAALRRGPTSAIRYSEWAEKVTGGLAS
jgi:hypothetical protein